MRIAILGGAFDPPHLGHYLVAEQVLEQLHMDEVWFMVCYQYFPEFPVKFSHISSFHLRYQMALLSGLPERIVPSDFEAKFNKPSKTIDTLRLLKEKFLEHTFYWIIGSDQLKDFHLWNNWQDLVQQHNLIIFPRDTDYVNLSQRVRNAFQLESIPSNIMVLDERSLIVTTISSSSIRKRVRAGFSINNMVDAKVEKYIKENHLYTSSFSNSS